MADEYTSASNFGAAGDRPEQPTTPPKVPGPGKQFNGFTGQEEDAAPLNLSASPADQRILASPPHTDPLPDLIARAVEGRDGDAGIDVEAHVGPSLTEDALPGETPLPITAVHDTPELDTDTVPEIKTQGLDAAPTNDVLVDEQGVAVNHENSNDLPPYTGLDTQAYNDSLNARKDAEAQGQDLPEIEPPVPGDQVERDEPAPVEPEPTEPEPAESTDPEVK